MGKLGDDAVGEAYDKVGRVHGFGPDPAGREIDELAHQGQDIYDFPRAMIKEDNLEFSFSGLKSAFINLHHQCRAKGESLSYRGFVCFLPSSCTGYSYGKNQEGFGEIPC